MKFHKQGLAELVRLTSSTKTRGARETATRELRREREYVTDADGTASTLLRAGQTGSALIGVMLTITLAAAIGFVGTKVTSEIDDSITDRDLSKVSAENQTEYENATESISGGFADAMGLTDIIFLVLMFSVVLLALLSFRGGRAG